MVDSLVSIAVGNLNKILQDEVAMLMRVEKDVEGLLSTFTALQAVLKDAEGRLFKDKLVTLWLEKLKDLCYEVDDILDEWRTEALRSQADEGDGSRFSYKKVSRFLSPSTSFDHGILRHKIGTRIRIKKAKQRLDKIAGERSKLGLGVHSTAKQSIDSEIRSHQIGERETGFLVNESVIVGRRDDVEEVMGLLIGESSIDVHEVPAVVSIVGMGGLGKTTLAQLLYNDEKVQHHFEMRMWVCVSEDFDVTRITKSIIESATKSGCDSLALDPMQNRLREMLRGKRFLLVLDDVWSTESEKWGQLKGPFQAGAWGSKVIITTRREDVASAMGSTHVHKLRALSDEDCWSLFSQRALVNPSVEERSELENIAKKIVEKCGGLPLAVKTIGSVMSKERTKKEWDHVLQNESWSLLDVSGEGILAALLLSYYDLPSPLKQCFAYFSLFPKDRKIETDVLVKLWMAQGFIGSEGSRGMEEIGGLYIDMLVRRSLLQDVELDAEGNIRTFKMHDLVHDVALFVARGECLLVEEGKIGVDPRSVRHAAVLNDDVAVDAAILAASFEAEKLRTMIFLSERSSPPHEIPAVLLSNLVGQFGSLRALCLSRSNANKLPHTIGKLRHLRCLDLSWTKIVELPETVADLYNLQTLNLNYCRRLRKLPERLGKLINVRHLEVECTHALEYMPRGIGKLTVLRTLTKFIVGDGQKECSLAELKNLNHLQGKLSIVGLEKVVQMEEAREAELDKKQYLNELYLEYNGEEKVNGILESLLQPHSNLKLLSIEGYLGSTLPESMEDPSFSNLVTIQLYRCDTCKQLPCLGKLPSLKNLIISGMKEVRHVGVEFCGVDDDNNSSNNSGGVLFPKLEELCFECMKNWEEWEWELRGGVVIMPSLFTLRIFCCPKLKALPENLPLSLEELDLTFDYLLSFDGKLPVFPNLRRLKIYGCDGIKSIPGGWFGELQFLNELYISLCPELESLPEEIQHLTMLQTLEISDCPRLKERYKERPRLIEGGEDWHSPRLIEHYKEGGEDWHMIAHIPNIEFREQFARYYFERMV